MDTTATPTPEAKIKDERVGASLRALVDDAEHLLKNTARAGDERLENVRQRLHDELRHLRMQLDDIEATAGARMRHAARTTDHAVHDHPYAAMGLAAVAGLLLGVVLGRR